MNRQKQAALSLLIALGWAGGAWAAASGDPTEAPPVWLAAQPVAPGVASIAPGSAGAEVQVILSGRSRRLAVIDGEVVKVGDHYKGSRVVAIKANKVVMEDRSKSLDVTANVSKKKPVPVPVRKKRVVLPASDVSPKAMGSHQ